MDQRTVEACRDAVRRAHPLNPHASFRTHALGWDCLVLEAGGWMFKFPRHADAVIRLERECGTLAFAAAYSAVPLPRLSLVRDQRLASEGGPPLFSMHETIAGDILTEEAYAALTEPARETLCADIAATYVAFHAADPREACDRGVPAAPRWPDADVLRAVAADNLSRDDLILARGVLKRWDAQRDDVTVFGHFDTHGWNLALRDGSTRLAGLFDFGHSGTGPLHRDLSYPAFVSADCALRVARHYTQMTGRAVDLGHLLDSHAVLRLVELHDASAAQRGKRAAVFGATMRDRARALGGTPA